jgi:puromycin-sensitive aminopeptidase
MTTKNKSVRLANHVSPSLYNLTIKPDLESFTFSGKENIKLKIDKDVKEITLHSKDLDIETVKYKNGKNEQFSTRITYNNEKETATFYFKNIIKKGKGELSITFCGIINENLRGFYKSKYTLDGEEKYLATTQFEATDARRAFPCFDEPAHKAIFEVSFIIPNSHTTISNTLPINIQEHGSGFKIVSFAPSPIMSTYLLAFIIGEFEYVEGKGKNNVVIRVFTTKGKIHQAKFALDVAIKSLEFFEEYFDIPYPLENLDLIAIPDFEPAGMENWGAITFRESSILIDEKYSSFTNKQWVSTTISHEIAHQWFGNLVTMSWWTDLWLNEGFASYMEKVCTNYLFPHWNTWDLHISGGRYKNAIDIDSLKNSHPIEVEIYHPNEINETFDMVSYEKGTEIVRMIAEYIGEKNFRKGLSNYLKKHSYKNTNTKDLWDAFEKVSKKPISKIMSSWTKQPGFPLLSLSVEKNNAKIEQDRFFSSRITRKENKIKSLWQIPVVYKDIEKNINKKILIKNKEIIIKHKSIGKINIDEISFLKVSYDKETLDFLKKEIIENKMPLVDRLGIIRDVFALAEGGYIKTYEAFEIVKSYINEDKYIVWFEISSGLNKINNIISNEKYVNKYREYVLSLLSQKAQNIGFEKKEKENSTDILLRNLLISQAGFYGDKKIIKEAKKIFDNKIIKSIDSDIRGVIYNIVAQNGGIKEWKYFVEMYEKESLQEEKERILRALTNFKDKKILEKTLNYLVSKKVKDQDAPYMIASTWMNPYGKELTWNFLKKNWNIIIQKYGEGGLLLSKFISVLGTHTKTEDLNDIKKFFKKNVAPGAERTLEQAYEKIASNIAWIKDDKKDIENWLNKNY